MTAAPRRVRSPQPSGRRPVPHGQRHHHTTGQRGWWQQGTVDSGIVRQLAGEATQARRLLERAEAGPVDLLVQLARLGLAELDFDEGDQNGAIDRVRAVITSAPAELRATASLTLGELLIKADALEEAEEILGVLTRHRDDTYDDACRAYGEVLLRQGNLDESRRWLLEAADSDDTECSQRAAELLEVLRAARTTRT